MLDHQLVVCIDTNIVRATDLPSIRTPDRVSPSNQSTLLPSFSSLQRSANLDDGSKTVPESASKPASPRCRGCIDKKSAIDDIALAVTGLDDAVQTYGPRYRDHVCFLAPKCELHLTTFAETRTPTRMLTEDCTMGARLFEECQSGAAGINVRLPRSQSPGSTTFIPY
jgi:hypothetical protein